MREYMTVDEAARHFRKSKRYIRRHLKKGFVDSNLYGYPIRLRDSEVDVFVLPFDDI
jgi:hypothetical protein